MKIMNYICRKFHQGTILIDPNVLAMGLMSGILHPLFYFINRWLGMPWDSALLKFSGGAVGFTLLGKLIWRESRFFSGIGFKIYWHIALAFILPFLFILTAIKSGYPEVCLYWMVSMVIVLAIFISHWFMYFVDLVGGTLLAYLCCYLTGTPLYSAATFDVSAYLSVIVFTISSALFFSHSNYRGILAAQTIKHQREKNAILQAMAGSIVHEMRNLLGQLYGLLSRMQNSLPLPANQPQTSVATDRLKNVLQHIGVGFRVVNNGSRVITMILDEVNDKTIDPNTFQYLSAKQITALTLHEYGYQDDQERQRVSIRGDNFTFKGDGTLYAFVLFNLVKNALFYITAYPRAVITVTLQPGAAGQPNQVLVRDTGPGIPKDTLPKVFDSFYMAGKKGGTGLGLAYCKRVMTAFGGDITCTSVVGEYTEFCLSFPAVSATELDAYNQQVIEQARADLDGKRVLIVDDQATNRQIAAMYFTPFKVEIHRAENGLRAIEKLRARRYDLIVMDIQMPELDGCQATQQIRERLAGEHTARTVPILAYTSEPYHEALVKITQAGMDGLQTKPCGQIAFIQSVQACFRHAADAVMASQQTDQLKASTILVVDDSSINRTLTRSVLESSGMEVIEAAHGQAAIEVLAKKPCDAVLMDLQMPVLDGLAATERLRTDPALSHCVNIPVIALSGHDDQTTRDAARAAGMTAYLVKPLNEQQLLTTLHRCLSAVTGKVATRTGHAEPVAQEQVEPQPQHAPPLLAGAPLVAIPQLYSLRNIISEEKIARLMANFFVSAEQKLQEFRIACANNDHEGLKQLCHKFKGEAGQMAAQQLSAYVKSLEAQLQMGQPLEAETCLAKLAELVDATKKAIQDCLAMKQAT